MLTDREYRQLEWEISRIYSDIESDLVHKVCRYLSRNEGDIDIGDWRLRKLSGLGIMQKDIDRMLTTDTQRIQKELEEAVERAWNANNETDGKVLKAIKRHVSDGTPLRLTASDIQTQKIASVIANARKAINLTNTKAQQAALGSFTSAVNNAYLSVYEGADTLDNAVWKASRHLARKGIMVATYDSGSQYTISMDAAVRRNVVTSVAQSTAEQSIFVTKENGLDLVKVSEHVGARPEHFLWQGGVYSLEGKTNGYRTLVEATGYGRADGLCGCNCRHHFFPWVEGFKPEDYGIDLSPKENEEIYEATQKQRGYERGVRSWKRVENEAKAQRRPEELAHARAMVKDYQSKLRDICERYDLPREYAREKV